MNVDAMRNVDYYVGLPLCAVLSGILGIVGLFKPRKAITKPARVLFIELSEMGSVVLADPAMQKTERDLGAEVFFLIFERNKGSLLLANQIAEKNIFTIRENNLINLTIDTIRFLFWTRANQIDAVVDLELFSRFTALLTGLSGAAMRVGFHAFYNEGLYRGNFLTHRVTYNTHIHIAKNFIALINALIAKDVERPYSKTAIGDDELVVRKVNPDEAAIDQVRQQIASVLPSYDASVHRIVLINPNASQLLPQRRWMAERYAGLITRILKSHDDVVVLITGSGAEKNEAEALVQSVGNQRCASFAGEVRIERLPALYVQASLMVSNDSGPVHFAAVTDMPVVGLFGPETPRLYGPLGRGSVVHAGLACSPCVSAANHRKTVCEDNQCIQVITVDQVYNACQEFL